MLHRLRGPIVLTLALAAAPAQATPRPLDRVVAVVDRSPIFLSELRARARPFLKKAAEDAGRPLSEAELAATYKELLERLIDEIVIKAEADKRSLGATSDEVDKAIDNVANQTKMTLDAILGEAQRLGMSRQDYRDEIQRQIVDAKWMFLVIKPRVRVIASDEAAFLKAMNEERAKELAILRAKHWIEVRP